MKIKANLNAIKVNMNISSIAIHLVNREYTFNNGVASWYIFPMGNGERLETNDIQYETTLFCHVYCVCMYVFACF